MFNNLFLFEALWMLHIKVLKRILLNVLTYDNVIKLALILYFIKSEIISLNICTECYV